MYYVYVLRSKIKWPPDNTGYTGDLWKRLGENKGKKIFYTKHNRPYELIYYEASLHEWDARARERYLKSGMGKRYLNNRLKRFLALTG